MAGYICSTYKCFINAPPHMSATDKCPMCQKNHFDGGTEKSASKKTSEKAEKKLAEKDDTSAKPRKKKT